MEVKPGYKQTEVGVIPEEWNVKLLPEVLRFRAGKAHEQHISETGRYVCVNSKFISTDGEVRKHSRVNFCPASKGDVLMVMSDLPNGRALAKAYLVEKGDTYAVNQRVCALTAYRDCPEYFFYVLNRHPYFLKFDNGVSQTHLLNHVFQKCPIPVPPKVAEQHAIATALSDVDGLLGGLDRLIAKKHDLKQAAMQQLLTGQTRLPGFHGDWEVKRLGDLAAISMGQSPDSNNYNLTGDGLPLIQGNADIENRRSIARVWTTHITKQGHPGDLLLTVRAPVGAVGRISERCCLGRGVCSLSPVGDVEFLFQALVFAEQAWKSLEQGSTFTSANSTQVCAFSVPVPADLAEQTAIAEVLSDMDAELVALEQWREKTRALKQAMMQELLTGKIRLVGKN
jgi:type I restriction enzyme S subunit